MTQNKTVMVLGGYGNFGRLITQQLLKHKIAVIVNGRNEKKASEFINKLKLDNPDCQVEIAIFDAQKSLQDALTKYQPFVLIHTCGPFQNQDTHIAETCIRQGVHYIDLADGRDFIHDILKLNDLAEQHHTTAISGASSVPALTSAVLDHYMHDTTNGFVEFDLVQYGISPGQKTDRGGLATVKSVLTYIGKPIRLASDQEEIRYGWQDIYLQKYPEISNRLMGNCEIPDLDFIPQHYPVKKLQFSAGMESKLLHILVWLTSWLIRFKLPINLPKHARFLMKASYWFNFLGTYNGGMHVTMKGKNKHNQHREKTWYIIAKNNHGPYIPTVPAVIMAKKILNGECNKPGVLPCIGFISLQEYLSELKGLDVSTHETSKNDLN